MNTAISPSSSIVLASASKVRARLLRAAGIPVEIAPANVDEEEVKLSLHAECAAAIDAAVMLAEMKAQRVSRAKGGAMVIGADQILVLDKQWFDKPADCNGAKAHLKALSGKTHGLATAAVIVRDGHRLWHHVSTPKLTMRVLSDDFIDDYLDKVGDAALTSVGAYQLEGLGAQLFTRVDGDFFTILGLPLLQVLGFLREHRLVPS